MREIVNTIFLGYLLLKLGMSLSLVNQGPLPQVQTDKNTLRGTKKLKETGVREWLEILITHKLAGRKMCNCILRIDLNFKSNAIKETRPAPG